MQNQAEEIILLPTNDGKNRHNEAKAFRLDKNSGDYPADKRKQRLLKRLLQPPNRVDLYKNVLLWIILFGCLFALAAPLALHLSYALPAIRPRTIPLHEFSEERARDFFPNLTQYGPRVINTAADYRTRELLLAQLARIRATARESLRLEISLQNFTANDIENLQNIAVRLSDIHSPSNTSCLMLSAHYDSVEFSPGGSDDGSGVVILLEMLSNLVHDPTFTFSQMHLIVLFTTAEEMSMSGAEAFVTGHPWKNDVRRFINIDSTGGHEKAILFQIKPSQLIRDYYHVPRPHANVIGDELLEHTSSTTDFNIFTSLGLLSGYDFAYYLDGYNYHTLLDKPSIVEEGALQHLGDNTLALARRLLDAYSSSQQSDTVFDEEDLIYFDVLGRHLITYRKSTGNLIQAILIGLVLIVGLLVIIFDHLWSGRNTSASDFTSIYFYFKYPLVLRCLFLLLFSLTYLFSFIFGPFFATVIAYILSKFRSLSWFGNATLAIFLYGLPCLIGMILCESLWSYLRQVLLSKYPKKNPMEMNTIKHIHRVCFNFERHWALLLLFVFLMSLAIYFPYRSSYFILLWSIFLCPIYLLLILFEFLTRWLRIKTWNLFHEHGWYWLFAPYLISLVPLIHTLEMTSRLLRLVIPMMARMTNPIRLSHDIVICSLVVISAVFFFLILLPNLQRVVNYNRILIVLTLSFFIVLAVACFRPSFTSEHPKLLSVHHTSDTVYSLTNPEQSPVVLSKSSQTASITIKSYDNLSLSPTLDRIAKRTGHTLTNRQCSTPTECSFDDTFNRTIAFQQVQLTSIQTPNQYQFLIRHLPSYQIDVEPGVFYGKLSVENAKVRPRTETVVHVQTFRQPASFSFTIKLYRCDLADSPFLLTLVDRLPDVTLFGDSHCLSIEDQLHVSVNQLK